MSLIGTSVGRQVRSGVAAVLVVTALVVLPALPARACQCAPPSHNVRSQLADADGAFVGTVVERTSLRPGSGAEAFRFRVEHEIKGDIGDSVTLTKGSIDGDFAVLTDCEFEGGDVGERMGLFVGRHDDGTWGAGMCGSIVDPDALLEAAKPLPRPDGRGPPVLLAGGDLGGTRLVTFDAEGRVVAYGAGSGELKAVDACPGGVTVVELVKQDVFDPGEVVVRDLASLQVQRTVSLAGTAHQLWHWNGDVSCRDATASEIAFRLDRKDATGAAATTRLGRVLADGTVVTSWEGPAFAVAFDSRHPRAFVTVPQGEASELLVIGLGDGSVHRRHPIDGRAYTLAPPGDGDDVAVATALGPTTWPTRGRQRLVLVPTEGGRLVERMLRGRDQVRHLLWDHGTLIGVRWEGGHATVESYDTRLQKVGSNDRWPYGPLAVSHGRLYGLDTDFWSKEGSVVRMDPRRGEPARVHRLVPATGFEVMVAIPSANAAAPAPSDRPWAWQAGAAAVLVAVIVAATSLRRRVRR